jgi:hypothetical protein
VERKFDRDVRVAVEFIELPVLSLVGWEHYQGWAKLVLIALERYSVALKRLTSNLR